MNYKLYLAKDFNNYTKRIPCDYIEEVEIYLELATKSEYNYYMIIQHDLKTNTDILFEHGEIKHEINNRLIKKLDHKIK